MTAPLSGTKEAIVLAMLRTTNFPSMRAIGLASGLLDGSEPRNGAKLRVVQRAIIKLVKSGLVHQKIDSSKTENAYRLTPAGKAFAATNYSKEASPKRRADQPAAEARR